MGSDGTFETKECACYQMEFASQVSPNRLKTVDFKTTQTRRTTPLRRHCNIFKKALTFMEALRSTALCKLLSGRLEFPTFPNVVNKPPVKGSINLSQYFVLLPLGQELFDASLEYLIFETCAWRPAYLSSAASSHLEYLTVCACWIPNYVLPSSGTLKCVCEHLILFYFISRISAITRNTQVCVNILFCCILYQGFQIFR